MTIQETSCGCFEGCYFVLAQYNFSNVIQRAAYYNEDGVTRSKYLVAIFKVKPKA